uniref:DUF3080 family protein n=1 Tax=uncultured Halomonas sp. TaxID=173971 RepID=UPI00261C4AB8|nr:DUF3080 family protein [uncultured Halomonas sp.]
MTNATRFIPDALYRGALGIALALILAGCDGGGTSDLLLRDYQAALAERLGVAPPEHAQPRNIGAFPELRERRLPVPETRESLLNVYALRECHITTLVAEHNSTLGRVAPASQRWQYALELWRRLTACRNSEVADRLAPDDLARLERLVTTKRRQLPLATWNGLFGSDAWAQSFSRVSSALEPDALAPPSEQLAALDYLHRLSHAPFEARLALPDPEALEGHLQALNERSYTAQLLRTLVLGEQRLREANALLDQALAAPGHCPSESFIARPGQTPEAQRLTGWVAALDDAATRWLAGLAPLFDGVETPPQAVQAYHRAWLSRHEAEAPYTGFRRAWQGHLERRRRLASRC